MFLSYLAFLTRSEGFRPGRFVKKYMVVDNINGDDFFLFKQTQAWFVVCLVLLTNPLVAQDYKLIDSLNKGLSQKLEDSVRIEYLNELSWQWRKKDGDRALDFADLALELSLSTNRQQDIATSLNRIGEVYRLRGEYRMAIEQFKNALAIEVKIGHQHGMARATSQLGTLYKNLGQYDSSLFYARQGLELFKKTENVPAIGRSHSRVATIYKNLGKFGLAIAHSDSALEIQVEQADEDDIAHSYLSLGNLYKDLGFLDSAMSQYSKSLFIRDRTNDEYEKALVFNAIGNVYYLQNSYDSALSYFMRSLSLKEKTGGSGTMDITYNNIGNVFGNIGKSDSALIYYLKSLEIKENNNDSVGLALVYNNIGNIFKLKDDLDSALVHFSQSLKYSEGSQDLKILIETYYNISEIHAQLENFNEALEFKNKYLKVRDTLDSSFRSAVAIRNRYEAEKSRRVIVEQEQLIKAAELEQLKSENEIKKMIILIIILALFCIVLALVFYYRSRLQKQKVLIAEKDKNIAEQRVHELLRKQEIHAMNAMIEGQEGERKRIAQDLHDRLGSMLSMVKIHFKSVEDNIEGLKVRNKEQYQKANNLLDEACEEVRKISHDMVSGVLTKFGLLPALKSLEKSVQETGQLNMKVLAFGLEGERLDYETEINVYRIIQELLSNVLKHAKANEITVQLIKKNENLNLVVEDDGVGFNMDSDGSSDGMGLKNIDTRVDKLNGEVQIDTGKGSGTTITIDFPITS